MKKKPGFLPLLSVASRATGLIENPSLEKKHTTASQMPDKIRSESEGKGLGCESPKAYPRKGKGSWSVARRNVMHRADTIGY